MKKEEVKIAVFSSFDKVGGAARSCYDLVRLLRNNGYQAIEVVSQKTGQEDFVFPVYKHRRDSIIRRCWRKLFSLGSKISLEYDTKKDYCFFGDENKSRTNPSIQDFENSIPFRPDLIFVSHTFGLLNSDMLLQFKEQWGSNIFYLCSDIGAYTGGCHVHWDCDGFTKGCVNCPAITVQARKQEVSEAFVRKMNNVINGNIGICYSNQWMYEEICKSLMFCQQPKLQLSQFTDVKTFTTINRDIAKKVFGINTQSFVIMFGASHLSDKRKGASYFLEVVKNLPKVVDEDRNKIISILIVGQKNDDFESILSDNTDYELCSLEFIEDMRLLSLAFQASDVFVSTSLEDAGPMMVSNALACGTPVVGFKTGLIFDNSIVIQNETGFPCNMYDVDEVARGIAYFYALSVEEFQICSMKCREIAEKKLSNQVAVNSIRELVDNL